MPTYIVKWPSEGAWLAWSGALGTLVGAIMRHFGIEPEIIIPTVAFVTGSIRLVTGAALPTPNTEEAVKDVIANTEGSGYK